MVPQLLGKINHKSIFIYQVLVCWFSLLLSWSCLFSQPVSETLENKAVIIFSKPLHILVP